MANINSTVRDSSGKTIDDYKRMYAEAQKNNDAAAMKAANDAANAIRDANNVKREDASQDIAGVASGELDYSSGSPVRKPSTGSSDKDYVPLNQNNYSGDGYDEQVRKQLEAIEENPLLVQGLSKAEYEKLFGHLSDIPNSGYMTSDLAEAQKSAEYWGVSITPHENYRNGQTWYEVGRAEREETEGNSNADAGKLSQEDYLAVLYAQDQWARDNELYEQALNAGNTELAAQYKESRDAWHVAAERIRSNYGYGGGEDGTMHIDYWLGAMTGDMPAMTDSIKKNLDAKGIDYALPSWEQEKTPQGTSPSGAGSAGGAYGSGAVPGQSGTAGNPSVPQVTLPEIPEFKVPGTSEETELSSQVNDYSDYIREMIAAQQEADAAAFLEAFNQNVNALDRAGAGLEESFQNARNQTAGAADIANRNFAEFANARGLNSGAEGQAALSRSIALQNDQNAINTQEAQSYADLQQKYADNEAWYNSAIAEMEAQGKLQEAQMLYQEKIRVETATIELMQQQFQNEITQYQLKYQALRDSVADAQWQQAFDMQYQQWLQDVEVQMAQLEMQKQSLELQAQQYGANLDQQEWENSFSMQQYYDKLAQNGYTPQNVAGGLFGSGSGTPSAGTPGSGTPSVSYNNGGLDSWQIKQIQAALGVDQDGYYGPQTQAAAGDTSASDLWYLLHHAGDTKDEAMLSESAWNWYKQYGDKVGYQSRGLQDFDNYQDYARDFLNFALASA